MQKKLSELTKIISILDEDAAAGAVSAGSVASAPGLLFGGSKTPIKRPLVQGTDSRTVDTKERMKKRYASLRALIRRRQQVQEGFDSAGVTAHLQSFSRAQQAASQTPTKCFGLEDNSGNVVKVYVDADQADAFENELQHTLQDAEEEVEIAELLFSLKDKYNIMNTVFPTVEEDEEETTGVKGKKGETQDQAAPDPDEDLPEEGQNGEGSDDEDGGEFDMGLSDEGSDDTVSDEEHDALLNGMPEEDSADVGNVESLLKQVIDMMAADAEARKAEAEARAEEAKARDTQLAASQAWAKVKQEEQVLDIEAQEKAERDQEEETTRLAKLASYQHQVGEKVPGLDDEPEKATISSGSKKSSDEDEEITLPKPQKKVGTADVARFIMSRAK